MVASLMTMNSIGASDDYVEVPTFLITNSARSESLQRSERSYNSRHQSLLDAVPGVPAMDYPVYSNVPLTGFNCYGKNFGGKLGQSIFGMNSASHLKIFACCGRRVRIKLGFALPWLIILLYIVLHYDDPTGYYADPRSACQSFHVCDRSGGHFSFLCPNGTIFNQQIFACDW